MGRARGRQQDAVPVLRGSHDLEGAPGEEPVAADSGGGARHIAGACPLPESQRRPAAARGAPPQQPVTEETDIQETDLRDIERSRLRCLTDWRYAEHLEPSLLAQVIKEATETYRCIDSYYHSQDDSLLLVLHNPMSRLRQWHESWDMALHSNVGFRNYLELVAASIAPWTSMEEVKYQEEQTEKELEALKQAKALELAALTEPPTPAPSGKKGKSASPKKSKSPKGKTPPPKPEPEPEPEPEEPKNPFIREGSLKFSGYNMGDKLIQVSGGGRFLYPSDGGQIHVEKVVFEKGPTFVKVKVMKDGHSFFIHITDPQKSHTEEYEDEGQAATQLADKKVSEKSHKEEKSVSKFGSFSGILMNGVQLSLSKYGPSGKAREKKDPELEAMLNFPSILTSSDIPAAPAPPATPPGKGGKSPRKQKSASPKSGRKKTPVPTEAPIEEPPKPTEMTAEPVPAAVAAPEPVPEVPVFQSLNLSCPNGLHVTFLSEATLAASWPPRKLEGLPPSGSEPTSVCGEVLKPEDVVDKLLVRQTYPTRVWTSQIYKSGAKPPIQELSRVICSQGAVVKHMTDGSTQVLFADGSVSNSPDSGPVFPPGQNPPPVPGTQDGLSQGMVTPPPDTNELQQSDNRPETPSKKGKVSYKANPVPPLKLEASEPPVPQQQLPGMHVPQVQPGTWITTSPLGLKVGTRGTEKLESPPVLWFKATDPVNGTVMTTREDKVVTVQRTDGTFIVEHADGTRITTFYQDLALAVPGEREETGEKPQTITRRGKFIRVENQDFATVIVNCEENSVYVTFGDRTAVLAKPQGVYEVFPMGGGRLSIDHLGCATYFSVPSRSFQVLPSDDPQELPTGSYTMRHAADVVCDVMDSEGNLFQVMVDGMVSVVVPGSELDEEEEMEMETFRKDGGISQLNVTRSYPPVKYYNHFPRLFIINADGSGTELLRDKEVDEYLTLCYSDPTTAVIEEPAPEQPGVQAITILRPFPETSRWTMRKEIDNIVPPNLLSRSWENFPPVERKTPGPPFGTKVWKGLCIGSMMVPRARMPVLRCPNVLLVRQLMRYEAIHNEVRRRLQLSLKEYIDHVLKKDHELNAMNLKDPRASEEKVHAADLLKLVLSFPPDSKRSSNGSAEDEADIAAIYELSVAPKPEPPPPMAQPERSAEDWERSRREIQDAKDQLLAIKKQLVPPYFKSQLGIAFLLSQGPDMEALSRQLPPFQKSEGVEIDSEGSEVLPYCTPEPGRSMLLDSGNSTYEDISVPRLASSSSQHKHGLPSEVLIREMDTTHSKAKSSPTDRRVHPLAQSLMVDVTGQPRKGGVKLPLSILSEKPAYLLNERFMTVESPVKRKVNTSSVAGAPLNTGGKSLPQGFHLLPAELDFGVLREGYTYCATVTMKNIGVDLCRFRVKQPPPGTGLRVIYKPGPVAPGMKVELEIELFAVAVGLEGPEGSGAVSHDIEVHAETEMLFLPVSAIVLTENLHDNRPQGCPTGGRNPGIRLVGTVPSSRVGLLRPRKIPS